MQFLKFLLGGGLGVIAYYTALYLLTEFAGWWYIASAIVGWVLNLGINFVVQKFWTFENNSKQAVPQQLILYFAMHLGFLVSGTGGLYFLVEYLGVWYLTAQLMITFVQTIVSFMITRQIFRKAPVA